MRTTIGRILVVDDERSNIEAMKDSLEDVHYKVWSAFDASQAQNIVSQEELDLVIMDIWMPGLDGISLLKQWRIQGISVPVVIMSGHGDVQTAVDAMKLGAIDYFSKPLHNLLPNVRAIFARLAQMKKTNNFDMSFKQAKTEFEYKYFVYHLGKNGYNMAKVAQFCGLDRTTLYRKLKDLGINKK